MQSTPGRWRSSRPEKRRMNGMRIQGPIFYGEVGPERMSDTCIVMLEQKKEDIAPILEGVLTSEYYTGTSENAPLLRAVLRLRFSALFTRQHKKAGLGKERKGG